MSLFLLPLCLKVSQVLLSKGPCLDKTKHALLISEILYRLQLQRKNVNQLFRKLKKEYKSIKECMFLCQCGHICSICK